MLGDRRPFPIMLIVPNFENLSAWAAQEGIPSADAGGPGRAAGGAGEDGARGPDDVARPGEFEMPKKLLLLPREFSIEAGELTPKLR